MENESELYTKGHRSALYCCDDSASWLLRKAVSNLVIHLLSLLAAKRIKGMTIENVAALVEACSHDYENITKMLFGNKRPSVEVANDAFFQTAAYGSEKMTRNSFWTLNSS